MRYFLLNSLILLGLLTPCVSAQNVISETKQDTTTFWTSEWRDATKKNEYRISITVLQARITGICIVKMVDGFWKGSIVNEFGLKVLDFESSAKNCKVFNVISFLDNGYIRKVLASDIGFMMEIDNPEYKIGANAFRQSVENNLLVNYKNKKEMIRYGNEEIKIGNYKHLIIYSLKKID